MENLISLQEKVTTEQEAPTLVPTDSLIDLADTPTPDTTTPASPEGYTASKPPSKRKARAIKAPLVSKKS